MVVVVAVHLAGGAAAAAAAAAATAAAANPEGAPAATAVCPAPRAAEMETHVMTLITDENSCYVNNELLVMTLTKTSRLTLQSNFTFKFTETASL